MISRRSEKYKLKPSDPWRDLMIHQAMLQDRLRTLSYKKAIENNVRANDIVLDLGCGTGILSFFAVKKGCKKIYAIEKSDIINDAIKIAKLNNLAKNIEFIKTDILRFKPKEKIDVLIHDQIGHCLWDEGIISKTTYIRKNFLKQNSIIIPYRIDLYLAPTSYKSNLEKSISFWSKKKYGINFNNLSTKLFVQAYPKALLSKIVELKDTKTFLCAEKLVYSVDLRKETKVPQKITASFRLKRNSELRGVCGYIKVYLDEDNIFSARPKATNTHWKHIFFPCIEKKVIKRDSILNFTFFPKGSHKEWKFKFEIK